MCSNSACKTAFDYSLDNSADVARDLLRDATGERLRHWKDVVSGYRRVKASLISALDVNTGRRTFTVEHAPSAHAKKEVFRKALSDAVFKERADAHGQTSQPVAAGLDEAMRTFGYALTAEEVDTNAVASDGELSKLAGVKRGMKLTRALGAYLRATGCDNDRASQIVEYVATAAQVKARKGIVTISANLLDILTCSENCAYTSCHKFNGQYRAGPQQYLQDCHTITVFYHEEDRRGMPYKTFRQMVYVDQERGGAALMRHYGQKLPESIHDTIRREIALLLARLKGIDGEPLWYRSDKDTLSIENGANLAYIDGVVEFVQLVKGADGRPQIALADTVPCAECGGALDESEALLCSSCDGNNRVTCCACGSRVDEDDCRSDDNGESYCDSCYSDRFTSCNRCGTELYVDGDSVNTVDGDDYCDRCFRRNFVTCDECSEVIPRGDALDIEGAGCYCESCASDLSGACEDCSETFLNDNLDEDCRCQDCAEAHATELDTELAARFSLTILQAPWAGDTTALSPDGFALLQALCA